MTDCTYRRRRIPDLPEPVRRAVDDELFSIERSLDCLQEQFSALPTGWEVTDTDTAAYPVGLTWGALTGLAIITPDIIPAGARFDISARIRVQNTGTEAGIISFSVGINGAPPTEDGVNITVAANYVGRVAISGWQVLATEVANGSTITVWAMEAAGNAPQFNPSITVTQPDNPHTFTVSVPFGSGSAVVTDLSVINVTATNVTVASSTGSDAILPAATASLAGVMTASQVGTLNTAATALRYVGKWSAGTYKLDDVVLTKRWLARARATTTQEPELVATGRKQILITEPAAPWTTYSAAWSEFGTQVASTTRRQILVGIRVKIPNPDYINVALGLNNDVYIDLFRGYYIDRSSWVDLYFAPYVIEAGTKVSLMVGAGSRYQALNYFPAVNDVKGFVRASWPILPGELTTTAYAVNGLYEDVTTWPSDWTLLSGY